MSALGLVPRPYEITRPDRGIDASHHDSASWWPREDGTLEVLARCGRHFTRQHKQLVWDGVEASCANKQCSGREKK